jgi:hypothetical protein
MRKLLLFLTFALVFCFGFSNAFAVAAVNVTGVTNTYPTGTLADTQLKAGQTHVISVEFDLSGESGLWQGSNTVDMYGTADWGYLQASKGPIMTSTLDGGTLNFFVGVFMNHFLKTGGSGSYGSAADGGPAANPGFVNGNATGTDTASFQIAFVAAGNYGLEAANTPGIAFTLEFASDLADDGEMICLEGNHERNGAWQWANLGNADFSPTWFNGLNNDPMRCWTVYAVPNQQPEWCDGVVSDNYDFSHCAEGTYTVCATDPDNTGPITYSLAPGSPGVVDPNTGVWTWSGGTVPQSGFVDVEFIANDSQDNTQDNFVLHVEVTNQAPTIACPTSGVTVGIATTRKQNIAFGDADGCDAPSVSVIDDGAVAGFDINNVSVVGNEVFYTPDFFGATGARDVDMTVEVTDGDQTATCVLHWTVSEGSLYQVEIEKTQMTFQGHFEDVAITLVKADVNDGIGGFNFLIAYDASALSFQTATEGGVYDECGWEYFTYRYGADGNCSGGCPSGLLRVIGMAETNNGPWHPACLTPTVPITLANLRFLVTNDRTLECQYVPIRFFWVECGDNAISNEDGSKLFLAEKVFEFTEYGLPFLGGEITGEFAFPTYGGSQATLTAEDCFFNDEAHNKFAGPNVGFQNGGVDIACADSIDARGDINLNGLAYEIADAVMFTNYFVQGLSAFGLHVEGSIAASDANADGISLSVADLVYLIRVVVGDALPYPKTTPVAANFTASNGRLNVGSEMGAAHLVLEGDVTPVLLADNMDMKYMFDGENTSVLVYSTNADQKFSGDFLVADANVVSSEFATYEGQPVAAKLMPANFDLEQNYPNPFNPTADIAFQIPNGGAWKLDIYNVTGQRVTSFSGVSESGFETVTWDASDLSSGIYFYKLTAGDHSMTKKAVLLK